MNAKVIDTGFDRELPPDDAYADEAHRWSNQHDSTRIDSFANSLPNESGRIPVVWAEELATDRTFPKQLVAGLFDSVGIGMIYGASGTGKSTLSIDVGCHVAADLLWNGREVQNGLVIIVAAEAAEGTRRRIQAFIRHHDTNPSLCSLAIVEHALGFDTEAMDQLVATIRFHSESRKMPVRLVLIDTLAANESGKEDSEHFGRVIDGLARIRDCLKTMAVVVHHTGKMQEAGARGHSSLLAAMDTAIEVSNSNGVRIASVIKQRDGESGQGFEFALKPIGIGFREPDKRGFRETVTACVVEYKGPAQRPKKQPTTDHQVHALDALRLDHKDKGTARWTMKAACDLFSAYHAKVGDGQKLHRNTPRATITALGKQGFILIDGGFLSLQDV